MSRRAFGGKCIGVVEEPSSKTCCGDHDCEEFGADKCDCCLMHGESHSSCPDSTCKCGIDCECIGEGTFEDLIKRKIGSAVKILSLRMDDMEAALQEQKTRAMQSMDERMAAVQKLIIKSAAVAKLHAKEQFAMGKKCGAADAADAAQEAAEDAEEEADAAEAAKEAEHMSKKARTGVE